MPLCEVEKESPSKLNPFMGSINLASGWGSLISCSHFMIWKHYLWGMNWPIHGFIAGGISWLLTTGFYSVTTLVGFFIDWTIPCISSSGFASFQLSVYPFSYTYSGLSLSLIYSHIIIFSVILLIITVTVCSWNLV